ncbi:Inner membrane protein YrbG [Rhodobacteraceae bacterium THAF1]|uniref:calcium/sodium antiporter n=1 Tax=Palleronia sp. THAF1 TaxID=2587842 RepID=UPI000F41D712|nr:calcium/sodium antiporter [Palleronia sp. THAF1]QFU07142.1 Inner membrane protein YrbG [Palleronia sp. THAF1]VDC16703.1 Inner membrane protein YrbG [Rhodobacteraceae bacterium THAF1]
MTWALAILGLVVLVVAGDALVKGAVNLALRLGIPALIVSLTVVAFGTSAPEMLVSIDAVLSGVPGLALGNVVGSNTANVLLVLGLPALFFTLDTSVSEVRKTYLVMMAASVLFVALAFFGPFTWWNGLILLAVLAVILLEQAVEGMRTRIVPEDVEGADPNMAGWKVAAFLVVGLVGLPLGANLLIENARVIATEFGVSDAVIGLTLVAIGTSLPELATTLAAAKNNQSDVALGNVIGSNLFNLLAIIGVTALVGDVPVAESFLRVDLWVMLAASLVLAPFVFTRMKMGRIVGTLFCGLYVGYLIVVVMS